MLLVLKKNRLTETILLSTHNKGFECHIRILEHETCRFSRALICRAMIRRHWGVIYQSNHSYWTRGKNL